MTRSAMVQPRVERRHTPEGFGFQSQKRKVVGMDRWLMCLSNESFETLCVAEVSTRAGDRVRDRNSGMELKHGQGDRQSLIVLGKRTREEFLCRCAQAQGETVAVRLWDV